MAIRRVFAIAVAALFAAWVQPSPAQAGILYTYNLAVTGTSWTGSGTIAFDTVSGSSTADVTAFSFNVTSGNFGSPQTYSLSDIDTVSWSIDSSFDLTLLLQTNLIAFEGGQSAVLLANDGLSHPSPCTQTSLAGSISCSIVPISGEADMVGNAYGGVLSAVRPVPEPGSLALFAPALLGLAFFYRRKRA